MHAADPSRAYVTLGEACRRLDVKPATLYTYVSRGLIRRLATPGRKKSLYLLEDVERMRARSGARAAEGVVAAAAIRYGEPVVPTSVTEITAGGPRYRNRSALELAANGVPFESTAELLWTGMSIDDAVWPCDALPREIVRITRDLAPGDGTLNLHDVFALVTLTAGMARGAPLKRLADTASQWLAARQLIYALTGCFALLSKAQRYRPPKPGERVAEAVARSLDVRIASKALHALNAALTLSADHELNPATFVARVAASSEGDLHSCVAAAINTNSGARIARACDRLESALRGPGRAARLIHRLEEAGTGSDLATLGFNHPLYPGGDPRARCLLQLVHRMGTPSGQLRQALADIELAQRDYKLQPRLELALVVLAVALKLPNGAAAGLYTLGRVAGWVAHIAEQRLAGFLIRPRARFVAPGATIS